MKPLFICDGISVNTEMPEHVDTGKDARGRPMIGHSVPNFSVSLDWVPLLTLPTFAFLSRDHQPPWLFMWSMAFAIYLGCKWLTWRRATKPLGGATGCFRSICYLLLWPGMDPAPFLSPALPDARHRITWSGAAFKTVVGAFLLFGAARLARGDDTLWTGWLGMLGLILFLHFGTFELLALGLNKAGIGVEPVMRAPIRSRSLGEFWGQRWNTAFNDLAHELAFRPFVRTFEKLGSSLSKAGSRMPPPNVGRRRAVVWATFAVFAISGLVHELVISLPAHGGYGLPTTYFTLQGLGVLFERSRLGRHIGLGCGLWGWLFTAACTAGPAFWLFHPHFVRNVILPMLHALGGN
jgi:alginate O-acetyltransferase complex protein AlgI